MNQFYTPPENISGNELIITDDEAKHAARVLRKREGEEIFVTDGCGNRFTACIEHIDKRKIRATIIEKVSFSADSFNTELCMGLIRKRDRLEFAAEKATELGITKLTFFHADHTEPFNVRVDRLEATVMSAMKQSLRAFLPEITICNSLDEVLSRDMSGTIILQADPDGEDHISVHSEETLRLLMVVGPEGGLSEREMSLLNEQNLAKVSLGDYRLRAETAAIIMSARFGHKKSRS